MHTESSTIRYIFAFLCIIKRRKMMPTVLKEGKYRFFFFSNEGTEPPHIHVESDNKYAKFWLDHISLASSYGFKAYELSEISKIIERNQEMMRRQWNEYFR
jgi:hypothetical protein